MFPAKKGSVSGTITVAHDSNGSKTITVGFSTRVVDKKLSSEVGFKGIFKKVLIFALVGIGHILDTRVIGSGSVMRTAVIFFYLSNEGVSLLPEKSTSLSQSRSADLPGTPWTVWSPSAS